MKWCNRLIFLIMVASLCGLIIHVSKQEPGPAQSAGTIFALCFIYILAVCGVRIRERVDYYIRKERNIYLKSYKDEKRRRN